MIEQLSFQPAFSPLLIALIGAGLGALLLLRPAFPGLTAARWRTLALLRLAVIGLAVLAMFRPGCVTPVTRKQSAQLHVLLDTSRSMELPHRGDQSHRWDAVRQMVDENRAAISALTAEQVEVVWQSFDGQLRPFPLSGDWPELPPQPTGAETDIAGALQSALRSSRDKRVLGILLATDGVQNVTEPRADINDALGVLAAREIPLFAVPFGLPSGVGDVADLAIVSLPDHHSVAVKNRLGVKATLATRGFANQQLTVQLVLSRRGEPERVVDTRLVTPRSAAEQMVLDLAHVPAEPGQYRMAVRVLPMPGEVALRNNELTSFLTVEEGGLRVLLLAGNLGNEQIFLRQQIPAAAQGIELQFLAIYPNARDRWPVGGAVTEALRDPTYDVIVLMDLDSRALYRQGDREENLAAIEQHVARGKGLLMLGGDHSFGPGLWHSTPLADVLPVLMNRAERQEFGAPVNRAFHIERPLQLVPVEDHFLTRLGDDGQSRAVWSRMPPLVCANRFSRIKDTAELLLESDAGDPLLVAGSYGAGRVVAFAGDSTWRWVLKGLDAEYRAFWRQLLYWLAFRDGQSNDLVRIELPRRRFAPESPVSFSAEAWTSGGQRINDARFEAWLEAPNGNESPITLVRSGERDWAELDRSLVAEPGIYSIRVRASRNGESIGETSREFSIADADREKANPAADHEFLRRICDETSAAGGRVVLPEQLGPFLEELRQSLPDLQVRIPVRWQLGQTAGDATAFLVLFAGLLGVEWYLRKRWGLI